MEFFRNLNQVLWSISTICVRPHPALPEMNIEYLRYSIDFNSTPLPMLKLSTTIPICFIPEVGDRDEK
jgi:hypothetical protein